MEHPSPFLPQRGNYRNLIVYQKSECIYDITFFFAHKYLGKGDRTTDQMIQAARSCKQNIIEGKLSQHNIKGNRTETGERGKGKPSGTSRRL